MAHFGKQRLRPVEEYRAIPVVIEVVMISDLDHACRQTVGRDMFSRNAAQREKDQSALEEEGACMTNTTVKGAIVTGASGGIGREVAKRLARDGFAIAVNYAGNPDKAKHVVDEIQSAGGKAISVKGDIANAADVEHLFKETSTAFGNVNVVVHCAGIMPLLPINADGIESFDKVIAINLRGSFLVMGQAAKRLIAGGRIIVFSSSVIAKSFPNYGPYIASKAGVEGLMRVLANELRGRNITVNAVSPGPVATELFLKGKSEAQINDFSKIPPLERLGRPEDIANVVSFLAGPEGG
jgi:3-oxoacyl-[acyl-carrier protein] reductase